jgi:hypothetical protein
MEDLELQKIWKAYDSKLEEIKVLNLQSWALNLHSLETIQTYKAKSKLDALATFNIWAVVLGIVWMLFLGALVFGNRFQNPYFSFSISMILLFTIIAVGAYIRHTIIIKEIDYGQSITVMQKKLAQLETSTFRSTRIVWLQLPFYTTWFWHSQWISDPKFWMISFPITIGFFFLAIFLYRNITQENLHKKWVRMLMISGPEYTSVLQARGFIDEIEKFKKDIA